MPTPLMPDDAFDARFRRGLEHYPEQLPDPAAWHRMDLLLRADAQQRALRRRVLRLLGGEAVLLLLGLWAVGSWALTAGRIAAGQPRKLAAQNSTPAAARRRAAGSAGARPAPAAKPAARAKTRFSAPPAAALAKLPAETSPAAIARKKPGPGGASAAAQLASAPKNPLRAAPGAMAWAAGGTPKPSRRALRSPAAAAEQLATGRPPAPAAAATAGRRPGAAAVVIPGPGVRPTRGPDRRGGRLLGGARVPASGRARRSAPDRPGALATNPAVQSAASALASPAAPPDLLAARHLPPALAVPLPDSLAGVALLALAPPADSLPPPRPKPTLLAYRLRLGLVAAPELSTVRAGRLSAPGRNLGLQLDYQLARRWHLTAGYLLTLKRYAARGTDYHLPAGIALPPSLVISGVEAVCRIVDIPLNLRYDLWQRPRYQVFASAGLSSLLMRREQYTYDYEPIAGRPVPSDDWLLRNNSQHLLKILNLSAGYEWALRPRWTAQVEPFVKLPLAGVGFGSVRLTSAGVFFSLRYGLLPRPAAPAPVR